MITPIKDGFRRHLGFKGSFRQHLQDGGRRWCVQSRWVRRGARMQSLAVGTERSRLA